VTAPFDVAIIGAGASGTLTAVQYARIAGEGARGALIDAGARAARGLAYGTPYGAHLLNVPAGRMSAFPDDPEHFYRWLRARYATAQPGTFAPRALYGDYLASLLADEPAYSRVQRMGGSAVGLTRSGDDWLVHLHDGRTLAARNVVLALGNLPPADPLQLDGDPPAEYVRDPWAPGAAIGLSPDAPVLLIGSGLTAVDVAVALRHEGHRGVIYALSRHGRLPHPHAPFTAHPVELPGECATPLGALRYVRGRVAAGEEWRAVVDSLRPHTTPIWQAWSLAQRGAFLRHLKNLWDVHRHRAAPEVRAELSVELLRGRIVALYPGIRVEWRPAGAVSARTLEVARVINCTGPASDYARLDLPLVVQMRRAGWLTPDPLRLGIETATDGRLLGTDGQPVDGLFTLGPLRRPALWESTAIPEIREQAAELAKLL
jgi:uncharacterized NAD(P)/FAD-binding protein YdhS